MVFYRAEDRRERSYYFIIKDTSALVNGIPITCETAVMLFTERSYYFMYWENHWVNAGANVPGCRPELRT